MASASFAGRMLVASLFAWPMVHNWFVSMGMLDFAIALPLSLALLLAWIGPLLSAPPLHAGCPPSPWLTSPEAGPAEGVKGGAE